MALLTKRWKDEQLIIKLSEAMTDEEFSKIKDHLHGNDNIYIRSFKIFFLEFYNMLFINNNVKSNVYQMLSISAIYLS